MVDVDITLNMEADDFLGMYSDYLRLLILDRLMAIYQEMGNDIYLLEHIYLDLKNEGLCYKRDILNIVRMAGKLNNLNCELYAVAEHIGRLNSAKFQLEREIEELQKKADHYDAILLEKSPQTRQF